MTLIEMCFGPGHVAGGVRGTFAWWGGVRGLGRVGWCVVFVPPFAITAQPVASQDCSISQRRGDWDDIRRFRDCIGAHGLDAWTPWVLHQAARLTTNPTIVRLLLRAGADPNAPDDNWLTPLHHGARNSNPVVVTHLLDAGADLHARDNEGFIYGS